MKTTVSKHDFCQAFTDYNREANFTWEGRQALYDYLEELESDTGTEMELDVIAICCDFSEYESAMEAVKEHDYEEVVDLEQLGSVDLQEVSAAEEEQALEWLRDRTTVIEFDGGIIIQAF